MRRDHAGFKASDWVQCYKCVSINSMCLSGLVPTHIFPFASGIALLLWTAPKPLDYCIYLLDYYAWFFTVWMVPLCSPSELKGPASSSSTFLLNLYFASKFMLMVRDKCFCNSFVWWLRQAPLRLTDLFTFLKSHASASWLSNRRIAQMHRIKLITGF